MVVNLKTGTKIYRAIIKRMPSKSNITALLSCTLYQFDGTWGQKLKHTNRKRERQGT